MNRGQIAADIHKRMVEDERFGYSWQERYGAKEEKWTVDGVTFNIGVGDYDCSSSVITAWKKALTGTKYAKSLDGATYTGNMRRIFVDSGLFEWKPMSFIASPGDLYLDEVNHVAMCQSQEPDLMSEFSISETGGTTGKRGDQTGRESAVNPYREFADGILHYNGKADTESQSETQKPSTSTNTATSGKKQLNGIDIASWQVGIDIASVDADFVIIKVSGGTDYVNPYWRGWANETLKAGKLLGLYHYACEYDSEPGGKAEAEFFLKQIEGFEGKFIPCLDWEAHACDVRVSYAKAWLDAVAKKTGSTPLFYSYASYVNNTDLSSISKYPLWVASYPYKYENGSGYVSNPDMITGTGNWKSATIYQYSSTRKISGYASRLDVNVFYGSAEDWKALCGGKEPTPTPTPDNPVIYRSSIDKSGKKWLGTYRNLSGDGHSGIFGEPMRWLAMKGVERYRVFTVDSGWLPWVTDYNVKDLENGCAGDGSPILGVQTDDDSVKYGVHVLGGKWYSYMVGLKDTGGSGDNFAGDLANKIDGFRALRV